MNNSKWTDFLYLALSGILSWWIIKEQNRAGNMEIGSGVTMAHKVRKVARRVDEWTTQYIDGQLDARRTV